MGSPARHRPPPTASPALSPAGAGLAGAVVTALRPESVLWIGRDPGPLVEELRGHEVQAFGLDVAAHARVLAADQATEQLSAGSLLDALTRRYDLIVCVGALELVAPEDTGRAVDNLCAHTDDLLLATAPDTSVEPDQVNVRPVEQWAELFARHGFFRDVDFDASFLAPGALRLRRTGEALERTVAAYERTLSRVLRENRARAELAQSQEARLTALRGELSLVRAELGEAEARVAREVTPLSDEVSRLSEELNSSERRLFDLDLDRRRLSAELKSMREAATYRLADRIHHVARRALPYDTRRGRALASGVRAAVLLSEQGPRAVASKVRARTGRASRAQPQPQADNPWDPEWLQRHYHDWLFHNDPDQAMRSLMRSESAGWTRRPLVSVIMPVYDPPLEWLEEAIASVSHQTYTEWELCIADDGSTQPWVRPLLEEAARRDRRVRLILCGHRGIAATSNAALALATGELVTFVDHDDILRPHALHRVVELLQQRDDVGVIYTDEDKLLLNGKRGEPFFKPHWSPDLLLAGNFLTHLTVIRRTLVDAVDGFRTGFDGGQDHDLFLRVTEEAARQKLSVEHVSDVLYTWRQSPGSAAFSHDAKPDAYVAGQKAIEEAVVRRGRHGTVQRARIPGWYVVRDEIVGNPTVEIVIPTRDRLDLLRTCITSIEQRSTYRNHRITIVDNDSREPETLEYLSSTPHRVIRDPGVFNYARIMNAAIAQVEADYVVLLNNDVEVISPEWLEGLLEQAQRPEVGAVGCRLRLRDGRVQHEGIAVGFGCPAANLDYSYYRHLSDAIRETTAVTGACMMVRREVWGELNGLDERLRVAYNDVDFCLRLWQAGYRVIYTPVAELWHEESSTRGTLHPQEDEVRFVARYGHHRRVSDAFMNPHIKLVTPLLLHIR